MPTKLTASESPEPSKDEATEGNGKEGSDSKEQNENAGDEQEPKGGAEGEIGGMLL